MKNILLYTFLLFAFNVSLAQSTAEIKIAGITNDVQQKVLDGDRISHYQFDNGGAFRNVKVYFKSEKGTKKFFSSLETNPDANGNYSFEHSVTVKEGSKVTFEGELEILVAIETIYKNVFWTKVSRTKDNLTDPITLDHYTKKRDSFNPAEGTLYLRFIAIERNNELKAKVKSNGDNWTKRARTDFHYYLKNEGDADWKVDAPVKLGMLTNGLEVDAKIENTNGIDIKKNMVIRIEVTTEQGNILWNEVTRKPHELRKPVYGKNYEIKSGTTSTDNNVDDNSNTTNNGGTLSTNDSNTSDNSDSQSKPDLSNNQNNATTTTEGNEKVEAPSTEIDLTTKTISAPCSDMAKGDTLVSVNGSKICIKSYKFEKSKWLKGRLGNPVNIEVQGVVYPLEANAQIKINKLTGNLVAGKLRANLKHSNAAGSFEMKKGSIVSFRNGTLYKCSITENTTLKAGALEFNCTSAGGEYDLRFDSRGNLEECTIGEPMQVTGAINFDFPAQTRFIIKGQKIWRAFCKEETSFMIGSNTYTVQASPGKKKPSYEFNDNFELVEVIAGTGNSIDIEGQSVGMASGKVIKFELADGAYFVSKFFASSEVTVKVYGKKVKDVTVKAGKKIVLEKGKVVKAG